MYTITEIIVAVTHLRKNKVLASIADGEQNK